MQYVVFDLEFKQDLESLVNTEPETNILSPKSKYPYEIIQIGAVKLDENLNMTDTFNRYVKPSIYARISPYIIELTGITPEKLLSEAGFDQVYKDFIKFIGDTETTLCVWGVTDIKTLHKNIMYHNLDENLLPQKFINIQPYASVHLGQSKKDCSASVTVPGKWALKQAHLFMTHYMTPYTPPRFLEYFFAPQ